MSLFFGSIRIHVGYLCRNDVVLHDAVPLYMYSSIRISKCPASSHQQQSQQFRMHTPAVPALLDTERIDKLHCGTLLPNHQQDGNTLFVHSVL